MRWRLEFRWWGGILPRIWTWPVSKTNFDGKPYPYFHAIDFGLFEIRIVNKEWPNQGYGKN